MFMSNCQKPTYILCFYHSLKLDMICGDGEIDGTSYEGVKLWGYA
jgi:hypothetical protein